MRPRGPPLPRRGEHGGTPRVTIGAMSSRDASFATTRWSVVLTAGRRSSADADQALAELCRGYWFPLYAYVRRRVGSVEEARDLTQEFFARLLEKNILAVARPQRPAALVILGDGGAVGDRQHSGARQPLLQPSRVPTELH